MSSVMPVPTSILAPLSYEDKEVVRLALVDDGSKIYAVASILLVFKGEDMIFPILKLRGALVLSRTMSRQHSLRLLALHGAAGEIIWLHDLSPNSALAEEKDAISERTYALRDQGLSATCIFADDVEASKFVAKFLRTVYRVPQQLFAQLDQMDSEDETIKGSAVRKLKKQKSSAAFGSPAWAASLELSSDERSEGVSTLAGPADSVDTSRKFLGNRASVSRKLRDQSRSGRQRNIPAVNSDTNYQDSAETSSPYSAYWTSNIKDVEIQIPDLTTQLVLETDGRATNCEGTGAFGIVRPIHLRDGRKVAIKTFRDDDGKITKDRKRFRNEAIVHHILSEKPHPNILPLLGVAEAGNLNLGASLVLPWMKNSNSLDYIRKYPQKPRLPLIHGTIRGIDFLHAKGIVHGDIKPANILISDAGEPLLSDFGLATLVDTGLLDISMPLLKAGTPMFMALELHRSNEPALNVTKQSDIWAFSMTIVQLLSKERILPHNGAEIKTSILSQDLKRYPKRPGTRECSDELWAFIKSCWNPAPMSRPTAEEALRVIDSITSRFNLSCTTPPSLAAK